MRKDLTTGTPWKIVLLFALPIMAGNLLQQLYNTAGILFLPDKQEDAERYGQADITEVEKIENVVLRKPKRHGHRLKNCQHHQRHQVFFHRFSPLYMPVRRLDKQGPVSQNHEQCSCSDQDAAHH